MKITMKSKIIAIVALLAIITVIISMANVSNAYSVSGSLSSSDKLVEGQNVSVTLSLSNIDADSGVMAITVDKINYDKNVFETVSKSNFVGSNGWSVSYSSNSQILTLTNDEHITSSGPVVTLNLKVKSGISANSTTVSFEGIVASAGLTTGDISVGTKSITISKQEEAKPAETTNTTNTTNTTEITNTTKPTETTNTANTAVTTNTTKTANTTNTTNTVKQTTSTAAQSKATLPKTGVNTGIILVITVGIAAGVIFYVKYKNLKKYDI